MIGSRITLSDWQLHPYGFAISKTNETNDLYLHLYQYGIKDSLCLPLCPWFSLVMVDAYLQGRAHISSGDSVSSQGAVAAHIGQW